MPDKVFRRYAAVDSSAYPRVLQIPNYTIKVYLPIFLFGIIWLLTALEPLAAAGNKEFPVIDLKTSGAQYLSPNGDGVQDSAEIGFGVTVWVKSEKGYVPAYGLKITDPAGKTVKEIETNDNSDVWWLPALFRGYEKFTLEKKVSWDGKDKSGTLMPDGRYSVSVWVKDSSQNRSELKIEDFVVDTVAPVAQVQPKADFIFSPNGDNYLDTFVISQTDSTVEAKWSGKIIDPAGNAIREYTWENTAPGDFGWDGKDNKGNLVPDGIYSYTLSATDLAGNKSGEFNIKGINLNTKDTPLYVSLDNPFFSPNGDGRQDVLTIRIKYARTEGLSGWSWSIKDQGGKVYHESKGNTNPPEEITIAGSDAGGVSMPEGFYFFIYEVVYQNGNRPQIKETICMDTTPPQVDLNISDPAFTPNSDNDKDTTTVSFYANEPVSWQAKIRSSSGEVVQEATANTEQVPLIWNGRDSRNQTVKDGRYSLEVLFTDRAGNQQTSEKLAVALSTQRYPVAVKAPRVFSPNSDGKLDKLVLQLEADNEQAVDKWSLDMEDESGETVRHFEGQKDIPKEVAWDGLVVDKQGAKAKAREGLYTAVLDAEYANGSRSTSEKARFLIDLTPPKVKLAVTSDPFMETDKGLEGEAFITLEVEDNTDIQGWTLDILNQQKEVIRSFSGEGSPTDQLAWNGEGEKGQKTGAQEIFTLKVNVTDAAGNESTYTQKMPLDIFVVKKNGKLYLMVPNIIFGAYKATLSSAGKTQLTRNQDTLQRVVKISQKYPQYKLLLEGHALNVFLGNKTKETREEKILYPLTEERTGTVRNALVDLGMDKGKIETQWFGGKHPLVSVKNKKIYWKNRRVEFIMVPDTATTDTSGQKTEQKIR